MEIHENPARTAPWLIFMCVCPAPGPVNVYFVMEKDGNDWMIAKIYASVSSSWNAIVQ
jgi:hypothetical protein